ncbi:MAG: DUF3501 family protein [Limnobacter sp.]|nr:DUF3501 family protein [Limnobacter sp.]
MTKIERNSLLSTSQYQLQRKTWRERVIPFKKLRTILLGNNVSILFENEFTARYQLQEMIRVDKSLENDPLDEELEIYNFLIPSKNSLKATLMFEFVDPGIRETKLAQLVGVEKSVWMQVDGCKKVFARCSNTVKPANPELASGVYFLSFELDDDSRQGFINGLAVSIGIDHPAYKHELEEIAPQTQVVLIEDLTSE